MCQEASTREKAKPLGETSLNPRSGKGQHCFI